MVWKLFLWSSLRKSYSICRENSDMAKFWPFKTKIWPFFGQNWQFWEFLTYNFQTPLWIFLIFGMEVVLMMFFEKFILYIPGKFWYGDILALLLRLKFGHFWPKMKVLRVLTCNIQTLLWIFLIFGMEAVLMVFFDKIILYMPRKFWYGEILALLRPKFGHFWPK